MLDLLRRVAFDPVLGRIPLGEAHDLLVPGDVRKAYTANVAPVPSEEETEDQDDVEMAPKDPPARAPARGHLGDLPAGPPRVETVPEDEAKTRARWDCFRRFVGNIWLAGSEKSKAPSPEAEAAVGERSGDLPTAAAAESTENYRKGICGLLAMNLFRNLNRKRKLLPL